MHTFKCVNLCVHVSVFCMYIYIKQGGTIIYGYSGIVVRRIKSVMITNLNARQIFGTDTVVDMLCIFSSINGFYWPSNNCRY